MSANLSKDDPSLGDALRRIGGRQIALALHAIEDRSSAKAIHEVRRSCKILRGLIRLVRTGFDDFADEDDAIREIARPLSAARDAKVMLDTFDFLARQAQGHAAHEVLLRLHSALKAEREARREAKRAKELLEDARGKLLTAQARCRLWTVEGEDWAVLAEGCAMTYGRMLKGADLAFIGRKREDFHKLRRHVRYHWCHARLLHPLWPEVMDARALAADELARMLGRHHDIAVCLAWLERDGSSLCAPDEQAPLFALAEREMGALEDRAQILCGRLLAEPADAFIAHWQAWWMNWQRASR